MPEYIERENAMQFVKKHMTEVNKENTIRIVSEVYEMATRHATDYLRFIPAADVVEVKHGKWQHFNHNSKARTCSVCNISQTVNVYNNKVMFNYCPYCGAKMDKKEGV